MSSFKIQWLEQQKPIQETRDEHSIWINKDYYRLWLEACKSALFVKSFHHKSAFFR